MLPDVVFLLATVALPLVSTNTVAFPLSFWALGYVLFALLVVHLCQRLVEHAGIAVDHKERFATFANTSLAIGSLVWALDVAGFFMYPAFAALDIHSGPLLVAWLLMVLSARFTVPSLISTRRPLMVVGAACGLAVGMFCAHLFVLQAFGQWHQQIDWPFTLAAMSLASIIAVSMALRHRSARLRAMNASFEPLGWAEKAMVATAILPLHWLLMQSLPIAIGGPHGFDNSFMPYVLAVFIVLQMVYFSRAMQVEQARQELLNRALLMVRSMPGSPAQLMEQQLALIAERLPRLMAPASLHLHYQPIVDQSGSAPSVRLEALLRVRDPELGPLPPDLVLLACERKGLTEHVDRQILRRALEESSLWVSRSLGCAGVSVNITPDTLLAEDFLAWLRRQLRELQIEPGWLQLELTEHALMAKSERLTETLSTLKMIGVSVVMDDFGTGFSSLGALIDLPIDGVKCDRRFVQDLLQDSKRQGVLAHLCAIAKTLQIHFTVEGVELPETLRLLQQMGADSIQGYWYAKPMPAARVPVWLCEFYDCYKPRAA
ncbi:EAL domain-containing protein [Permianibacter aggregans]|uniref:EAL domain-containing protein (Putative c-di-GMP-specific phosphodiesterase class I) n=1 Tax=Permianibacter aggregans TaxID=1510150 RepID=A0A4R6UQC9_9GAMM|nr:EAL domain-containing protein [Permianibacter aggregans]QGX40046.1 EAL domain-containing protein [Permianibacter aggregans]TDQ49142.1 EAL domain-containing protein (putative c-di-GMP-specific phosphodiesterase class I) [Permianibacter aggregans]